MTGCKRFFPLFLLAAAVFTFGPFAFADDAPPTTRAARLTYMQGSVTVTQANNTASVPAQLNLPLLAGVLLSTGQDGQAEIEFEDGSVVRLTPNSALALDNLTVDPDGVFTTVVSLLHGLAYAELRATPKYRYTVNAGGDFLSPVENTTVRVNFDEPPATFAVIDGTAHIERQGAGSATVYQADVRGGETFRPDTADQGRYFLTQGIASDTWDQWNEDLDQAASKQAADSTAVRNNYAGAQGYGWSDLDANGSWYDVPGQGPVWQPSIAADDSDFDPYDNGAWVAYSGVGYVWASAYPWGWTPYRCGNWSFFTGFGWGWAPGAGCGGFGWGFWGGGRVVNIGRAPNGYLPIHVPVHHGPEKPLLPVHSDHAYRGTAFAGNGDHRGGDHGPRQIGGVTATPIAPVYRGVSPGGTAIGSSLHRDFPVDSTTRTPVLGIAGTRPADIHSNTGTRPNGTHPQAPAASVWPGPAGEPARTGQSHPGASAARPDPSSPQFQRPNPNAATPRSAPPPSSSPAPSRSAEHPNYAPPASQPAQHPTYTPPPSRPVEHPTYSPPPSQPAPHPSYSPPPAPPASHPSPAPASAPAPAGHSPR